MNAWLRVVGLAVLMAFSFAMPAFSQEDAVKDDTGSTDMGVVKGEDGEDKVKRHKLGRGRVFGIVVNPILAICKVGAYPLDALDRMRYVTNDQPRRHPWKSFRAILHQTVATPLDSLEILLTTPATVIAGVHPVDPFNGAGWATYHLLEPFAPYQYARGPNSFRGTNFKSKVGRNLPSYPPKEVQSGTERRFKRDPAHSRKIGAGGPHAIPRGHGWWRPHNES